MIQATPFDPVVLTGAVDEPVQDYEVYSERVYRQFAERRDRFQDANSRLAGTPGLGGFGLRLPLTEDLFLQLRDTPLWSQVRRNSPLYKLKLAILAFLGNQQRNLNSTVYLNNAEIEHTYRLVNAPAFFLRSLAPELCDAWVEAVGACAFGHGVIEPQGTPLYIHAVWVVSVEQQRGTRELRIACTHILEADGNSEGCGLPVLTETDLWCWEFLVRESLWQDRRLPFRGPGGPFGYCPPQGWQPGERPSKYGYQDALGGRWEWKGGRARIVSPLDGHWDVQLPDSQARQRWTSCLEKGFQTPVRLRKNYINIEVDGQIADRTFDLG